MNRNLKIVWTIGIIVTLVLFCFQAYWLSCQYEYNLNRKTEQFKASCNQILQTETNARKAIADKKVAEKKESKSTIKIESEFFHQAKRKTASTITLYNNGKQLLRVREPNINTSESFEACDRYTACAEKQPAAGDFKKLLDKQGYRGMSGFKQTHYNQLFMEPRYSTIGKWQRTVKVDYQTNPLLHQGVTFCVPIPVSPILKSMLWQLAGSITLFIILAACMFYLIHTIVVQKRINAIRHTFLKNMIYELKQPKQEADNGEADIQIGHSTTFRYTQNELRTGSERIIITSRQAEILRLLALNQNQLVERDTILNQVWGDDSYANSLALNVQITYLRRALSSATDVSIEAVIKKGYILRTAKTEATTEP